MALGVVKSLAGFLLLLNFCIYLTVGAIAGWVLNSALDHTYFIGRRRALPVGFFPVYFPMGNEATGFMIIFALIASVVGAASCLSGLHHLRVWTAQSLSSSTASSMTAWALTLLAMGRALPVGFFPVYFPMGNEATGFMIIFALIASVVGAASCLSGLHHLRVWTAQSLSSSTASSMTAWALTLLAMGLGCKEIHIGGRNTKLITLESFLVIVSATKLFYILLIHAGFFGGNYCSYEDTDVATTTTTAEPQKGRTHAASSV